MDEAMDSGLRLIRNHIQKDPGMHTGSDNYNFLVQDCRVWFGQDGNEGVRLVSLANICAEFDEWSKDNSRRFFDLTFKVFEKPIKPESFVEHLISSGTPEAVDSYLAPLFASFPRKGKAQIKALAFKKPQILSISQSMTNKASKKPGFRLLKALGDALKVNKDLTKEEDFQEWLCVFTHNLVECVRIAEGMKQDQQLADEVAYIHATLAGVAFDNNQLESAARSAASALVPIISSHPYFPSNFLSQSPFFSRTPANGNKGPDSTPATLNNPEPIANNPKPVTTPAKDMFKDVFDRWPEELKQHLIPVALFFNNLWASNKELEEKVEHWQRQFQELARDVGREKNQNSISQSRVPDPQASNELVKLNASIHELEQELDKLKGEKYEMERDWCRPEVWKKNQDKLGVYEKQINELKISLDASRGSEKDLKEQVKNLEIERNNAIEKAESAEKRAEASEAKAISSEIEKERHESAKALALENNTRLRTQFESDVQRGIREKISSIQAVLGFEFDQIEQMLQGTSGTNPQDALPKIWASFSKKFRDQMEEAR